MSDIKDYIRENAFITELEAVEAVNDAVDALTFSGKYVGEYIEGYYSNSKVYYFYVLPNYPQFKRVIVEDINEVLPSQSRLEFEDSQRRRLRAGKADKARGAGTSKRGGRKSGKAGKLLRVLVRSDIRCKDIQYIIDTVDGVDLVVFKYEEHPASPKDMIGVDCVGVIAQQVVDAHPECVVETDGFLAVDYDMLCIKVPNLLNYLKN